MTVKELKDLLSEYPDSMPVVVEYDTQCHRHIEVERTNLIDRDSYYVVPITSQDFDHPLVEAVIINHEDMLPRDWKKKE
jgi:hypothetical protein